MRILGAPQASLLAVASDDPRVDPFVIADEMRLRPRWNLQPQPARAHSPAKVHLTVTAAVAGEERIADLLGEPAAAVERARATGPAIADP